MTRHFVFCPWHVDVETNRPYRILTRRLSSSYQQERINVPRYRSAPLSWLVYSHFFVFLLWVCSRQVRCVDIAVCGKDALIRRRSVAAVTCRGRRRIGYEVSARRLDHGECYILMPEFREYKERFDTQFKLFLATSANGTSVERWKGNAASRRCSGAPRLCDRSPSLPLACIPLALILQTQNVGTLSPGKEGIGRKQIIKKIDDISLFDGPSSMSTRRVF